MDGLEYWAELLSHVAVIVIALALIVAAVALVPVALGLRRLSRRIHALAARAQEGVTPILKHGEDVAANVNYIASSVRQDVERFKGTLRESQERLDAAAALAEQRIRDLNALLEVVQEEAEHLFISTASTIRGVRAGASALQAPRSDPEWDREAGETRGH